MSKSSIQDSRTDIFIPEFCHCARLLYASACTEYQNSNIPSYMYEAICFHVVLCRTKKMRKLSKSPNDSADSCGLDRIFIIIGTGQCVYPKSIRRDAALRIHASTTLSRHTHSDPDQIIWLLLEMFEKTLSTFSTMSMPSCVYTSIHLSPLTEHPAIWRPQIL